jgi:hypothetical protein
MRRQYGKLKTTARHTRMPEMPIVNTDGGISGE